MLYTYCPDRAIRSLMFTYTVFFADSYERNCGLPQLRVLDLNTNSSQMVALPESICSLHPGGNGVSPLLFINTYWSGLYVCGVNNNSGIMLLIYVEHLVSFVVYVCVFVQDFSATKFRFSYSSPTTPERIFDYDITTKQLSILKEKTVAGNDTHTHKTTYTFPTARTTITHTSKCKTLPPRKCSQIPPSATVLSLSLSLSLNPSHSTVSTILWD